MSGWHRIWRVTVHASVLVIIIGGILTWLTGKRGYIYLQEDAGYAMTWRMDDGEVMDLPFRLRLEKEDGTGKLSLRSDHNQESGTSVGVYDGHSAVIDGYKFTLGTVNKNRGVCRFNVNHDPVGEPVVYAGYLFFALSLIGCGYCRVRRADKRTDVRTVRRVILSAILIIVFLYFYVTVRWVGDGMSPMLRHPLLAWHIGAVIGSYILFAALSVVSVVSLCGRSVSPRVYTGILYSGLSLLSIGIALGSVWASDAWGSYWSWDPKETWALLCMIVYVIPLHPKYMPEFRKSRTRNIYYAIAILMVLFLWFGVDRIFAGLHSY